MTHSDIFKAFRVQRNMMLMTASWPKENPSLLYKIGGIISFMSCLGLGIVMSIEAFNDITDFAKLSEILYIMITIVVYYFKHGSFFFQRKYFLRILKILKSPEFNTYPEDLDYLVAKRIRHADILAKYYRNLVLACVSLISIAPIFSDDLITPFPFPYELGRYRYFMYFFQSFNCYLVGWINSCLDSLSACIISIAGTQLKILVQKIVRINQEFMLEKAKEDTKMTAQMERMVISDIKKCIDHHKAIIEYVECTDKVFSFGILSQFMGSIIIICNTLFHFILVPIGSSQFFSLVSYLAVMLSELFMYCWFGNEVIWESMQIGEACYLFNWYRCSNRIRKYLFIMMERSKRPLKITAFKFSTLSLRAFTSIMQWAYSYFALLLKMYKKENDISTENGVL